MDDTGATREDVKAPDGEVGDKIEKMQEEGKDISEYTSQSSARIGLTIISCHCPQGHG